MPSMSDCVWLAATAQEEGKEGKWKWNKESEEWTPNDPASIVYQQWANGQPDAITTVKTKTVLCSENMMVIGVMFHATKSTSQFANTN